MGRSAILLGPLQVNGVGTAVMQRDEELLEDSLVPLLVYRHCTPVVVLDENRADDALCAQRTPVCHLRRLQWMFMVDTFGRGSAPYPQALSVPVTMRVTVSFVLPPGVMRKCGTAGALRNEPFTEGLAHYLSFWRKCLGHLGSCIDEASASSSVCFELQILIGCLAGPGGGWRALGFSPRFT